VERDHAKQKAMQQAMHLAMQHGNFIPQVRYCTILLLYYYYALTSYHRMAWAAWAVGAWAVEAWAVGAWAVGAWVEASIMAWAIWVEAAAAVGA
jgi:hypothetical protein